MDYKTEKILRKFITKLITTDLRTQHIQHDLLLHNMSLNGETSKIAKTILLLQNTDLNYDFSLLDLHDLSLWKPITLHLNELKIIDINHIKNSFFKTVSVYNQFKIASVSKKFQTLNFLDINVLDQLFQVTFANIKIVYILNANSNLTGFINILNQAFCSYHIIQNIINYIFAAQFLYLYEQNSHQKQIHDFLTFEVLHIKKDIQILQSIILYKKLYHLKPKVNSIISKISKLIKDIQNSADYTLNDYILNFNTTMTIRFDMLKIKFNIANTNIIDNKIFQNLTEINFSFIDYETFLLKLFETLNNVFQKFYSVKHYLEYKSLNTQSILKIKIIQNQPLLQLINISINKIKMEEYKKNYDVLITQGYLKYKNLEKLFLFQQEMISILDKDILNKHTKIIENHKFIQNNIIYTDVAYQIYLKKIYLVYLLSLKPDTLQNNILQNQQKLISFIHHAQIIENHAKIKSLYSFDDLAFKDYYILIHEFYRNPDFETENDILNLQQSLI